MTMTEQIFGKTHAGATVLRYTLTNSSGLTIEVMNYGATLTSVKIPDRNGKLGEVTLGFDDFAGYLEAHPYFGVTVGRFANRIAKGRFTLKGKTYELACNEAGKIHLHGGNIGFDKVMWTADASERIITFLYSSPDGQEGYPGNLEVRATYALNEDNELTLEYFAEADQPTPINLTNHAYWNLAGAGSGTVMDHELTMRCSRYLPVDGDLIPTGEIGSVSGTPLDFTDKHRIGERIDQVAPSKGYDHCYIIDSDEPGGEPVPVLSLSDPVSGRCLEMRTTQPAVQIYTSGQLEEIKGRGDTTYTQFGAVAIEPECYPDAVNKPGFPSAILEPVATYRHVTVFKFSTD